MKMVTITKEEYVSLLKFKLSALMILRAEDPNGFYPIEELEDEISKLCSQDMNEPLHLMELEN